MNAPVLNAPRVVRLNAADNVVTAVDPVEAGAVAAGVTARTRIPRGHKMTTTGIPQGQPILKFGQIIGFAAKPIEPGEWVHEHNVEMHDFARDYRFAEDARQEEILPVAEQATFEGYPPQERPGRHAQLHRHPHLGELLGHRGPPHGGGDEPLGPAGRLSQHRRRHPARAGRRLRAGCEGRGLRDPQAHAVGLRHQPQRRRRGDGGGSHRSRLARSGTNCADQFFGSLRNIHVVENDAGPLPPSSILTGTRFRPQTSHTVLPTSGEPVSDMRLMPGMTGQCHAGDVAAAGNDVDDAVGQAGIFGDEAEVDGRKRVSPAGLDDDGVSGGQGGRDSPAGQHDGKVSREDERARSPRDAHCRCLVFGHGNRRLMFDLLAPDR